jgi:hypothetical protein
VPPRPLRRTSCVMSLPTWNDEWESPDPLRGGKGWARHHYADVATAAALAVMALGLTLPAIVSVRGSDSRVRRADAHRESELSPAALESVRQK